MHTGTGGGSDLIRHNSSSPVMPGMLMSLRTSTTSVRPWRVRMSSASSPE